MRCGGNTVCRAEQRRGYPCPCCAGVCDVPFLPGLVRCSFCGHVRAALDWSVERFRELYGEHYFKGGEYPDYEQEADALSINFRRRVLDLISLQPEGGRLLEIGCAYGFFLKEASRRFEVMGCDVAEDATRSAASKLGVDARCLDYLCWQPGTNFDVVCLWDTVEHLPDPEAFLNKAFGELKSGGILALSTGDISSLCARLRGQRWRLIHPPTHVHYFTRNSMETLLHRIGFGDVKIRYPAFWRNLDTTASKVLVEDGGGLSRTIYGILKSTGLLRLNYPMNLFDLMTVYARKP